MRNCGNCDYCADTDEGLVCINQESEYLSDFVDETHSCDEWDGTEENE